MDFENPTREMKEEAKTKFGLDLDDPAIIRELNRLKANGGRIPEEESSENPPPEQPQKQNTEEGNSWYFSIIFLVVFSALVLMIDF